MKVYFIGSGLQGCYALRCLFPLQENGWDGDQTSIVFENQTPENKMKAANAADIVVFHRPDSKNKLELAKLLKQQGKKIVYDNDDTFKDDGGFKFNEYFDEERMNKGLQKINEILDEFLGLADLVTCSTEFLAEEYRKLNPNVVVLPNLVDPFYFEEPLRNKSNVVRIGMVGSVAVTLDHEVMKPLVEKYQHDPRVQLVLFSLPPNRQDKMIRELYSEEYKFWDSINVEWHPYVDMNEYYDTLNELRLDMMIIPRADTYFNRCKSNVKFLEASMFEIPVIAQGFPDGKSPYQVNPDDAAHMIIANNQEEWIAAIEKLIGDKELRRSMGRKAHTYVRNNYSITDKGHLWVQAYENIDRKATDNVADN